MSDQARRLDVVVPLPGETLESWIAAYARRLHTTGSGLIAHLGWAPAASPTWLRLDDHEAAERTAALNAEIAGQPDNETR
jgi:hypothetical protein